MRSKCEYCGSYVESTEENCPNCGAVNPNHRRNAAGVPQTIEELKDFCAKHDLPLEEMRFFIGVDYKKPRAFGIYQDGDGNFVVYKNKADGSRAIRYKGTDEAYAVHELYLKMQSEVQNQKKRLSSGGGASEAEQARRAAYSDNPYNQDRRAQRPKGALSGCLGKLLLGIIFLVLFVGLFLAVDAFIPDKGYYSYENETYYYDSSDWYRYDSALGDWGYAHMDNTPLDKHYKDYQIGPYSSGDSDYTDFTESAYYQAPSDKEDSSTDWDDSDWDSSDWDWDSGDDWDSSYTDWDSDW